LYKTELVNGFKIFYREIQPVLTEPDWTQRMLPDDLRALTPLIYTHVTPGFFGST
jgi:hypothetical protein